MNIKVISRLYKYYLTQLPNIILVLIGASLILIFKNLPYINLIILNLDPIFSVILLLWIVYYFSNKPSSIKILKLSLIIIVIACVLVLLRSMDLANFIAPVFYLMILTVSIKELLALKGVVKKQKDVFND